MSPVCGCSIHKVLACSWAVCYTVSISIRMCDQHSHSVTTQSLMMLNKHFTISLHNWTDLWYMQKFVSNRSTLVTFSLKCMPCVSQLTLSPCSRGGGALSAARGKNVQCTLRLLVGQHSHVIDCNHLCLWTSYMTLQWIWVMYQMSNVNLVISTYFTETNQKSYFS